MGTTLMLAAPLVGCLDHGDPARIEIGERDCVVCHQPEYEATRNPPHVELFPVECTRCHGTEAWVPATLSEHEWWPIDGRHRDLACTSCHTVGYTAAETPETCVGCHREDYDASPFPGHSDFPLTCESCHTTDGWSPASGGHPESAFPIQRGDHRGFECNDCHDPERGAFQEGFNTDCVGCHTGDHNRSRMDDRHDDVGAYPGDDSRPSFCLRCHSAGLPVDD